MFTHIMVGAKDLAQSAKFYDAVLGALGAGAGHNIGDRAFYSHNGGTFGIISPINGEPATHANGGTIGFAAADKDQVDAFHAAGVANGGTSEGEPGKRPQAPGNAYGAYLRDPTGNKICVFCQLPEGA
ncbi:catechol 2,3-dioxygenase-like lactoylglutathione lyase family enzyme [Sphingobium sp. B2D3A]|uniref:VOC family protein n=1 Tax=Sphingobium TaxID=165695 RepID=UPI0015EB7FA6|nr:MULTISPECIES: VOC family protein [Sphingobium]MCW2337650.1 catechol 2,3-dioxygenase-like lactoylglutathione lyase family enzyme [Sphingobium sp. B2D3A]MCW2350719.1 catechol 2,3-dioxygenase-like lactoylglutathione lyase family enzyme [Sphingobium sp. B12D2B]MCW2362137.1 catechol 2,3-dioxygenase-like lactoylglutathione lyase family enzyme [Sphingobium sp. B10D3B]MCW2366069.1 catechol 2,3-dioxygenase-like lactoylglutathione lyase family enzyme [Sphingobium sp. B7D2B]MCW2381473.1 catechol 2,3-d